MTWKLAQRAEKMNPSVIREILKVTEKPGIISFAGGLPSPQTFPVEAMLEATKKVLTEDGRSALQYAASEGYGPLRDWVAHDLKKQGMSVDPDQVLITTGSQQGLDPGQNPHRRGQPNLVETPTHLGALRPTHPWSPPWWAWPVTTKVWTPPTCAPRPEEQAIRVPTQRVLFTCCPTFKTPPAAP